MILDDDEDWCMRPDEILLMFQRLERIFAMECSKIYMQSYVLVNNIADNRAERKFHMLMLKLKSQESQTQEEETLISFGEFQDALEKSPTLLNSLLPRTLTFQ